MLLGDLSKEPVASDASMRAPKVDSFQGSRVPIDRYIQEKCVGIGRVHHLVVVHQGETVGRIQNIAEENATATRPLTWEINCNAAIREDNEGRRLVGLDWRGLFDRQRRRSLSKLKAFFMHKLEVSTNVGASDLRVDLTAMVEYEWPGFPGFAILIRWHYRPSMADIRHNRDGLVREDSNPSFSRGMFPLTWHSGFPKVDGMLPRRSFRGAVVT